MTQPSSVLLPGHDVPIARHTVVRRLLPHRERRMVGAWCFVDHFDDDVEGGPGMDIAPHPHTGLQTVTWLLEGAVHHRDSLGSDQLVRPGELNLMTAGGGIAHSEHSPSSRPPRMHGLQLWIALPDGARDGAAGFEHHAALPTVEHDGVTATVVVGELLGRRSPATVHSPIVGAELRLGAGRHALPVDPAFEHALLALEGSTAVEGQDVACGALLVLEPGCDHVVLQADGPARLFLLGGEPFAAELVMWWNFVARSHDEIARARADWAAGSDRFGEVPGGETPLPAPAMPSVRLKPRGRTGGRSA